MKARLVDNYVAREGAIDLATLVHVAWAERARLLPYWTLSEFASHWRLLQG